jgi:hypothetical protein
MDARKKEKKGRWLQVLTFLGFLGLHVVVIFVFVVVIRTLFL